MLRCTLTHFERKLVIRIPSKLINKKNFNFYSTFINEKINLINNDIKSNYIDSFIKGFVDGEGCFSIVMVKDKSYKLGWQVKPKFSIGLHKKDKDLLEFIKDYLGIGGISSQGINGVQFYINSIKDHKILIEFFNKNTLYSKKNIDFYIYKLIIELIIRKEHLTQEGLQKIVALKSILNTGFLSED